MNAQVVYATITGNNEEVADVIVEALESAEVSVTKTEISQTEVDELESTDIAIIVPYTYDQGSLPDEGLDFFEDLAEADLSGVVYGVAGSGDTYYLSDFCLAVPKFETQLAQTNAIKGAEGVKINLHPDEKDTIVLQAFTQKLIQVAKNQ
ncbi:flavodoxin [Leuconostoc carnosum]|uniref:Flavodoxin n=2 Tax=Leuconostoc carnosum TaxID=1252 RepID=K0DD51_LEUCJ|nr:flavodoxin [Leuconostoc carnosum]AFT81951.1 flavodoxin [Leuconostoc carnosum JB16]KAA8328525.1 flavodoxin [Leuconostoc carnosum]KAA8371084.1 flavodoxin [Leuconostoc carnosum]KAA8382725.1 flavodoxin [Leuconostoc carnosum]QEA33999.1 flavodoxin [Leuconostoc carnosum]